MDKRIICSKTLVLLKTNFVKHLVHIKEKAVVTAQRLHTIKTF